MTLWSTLKRRLNRFRLELRRDANARRAFADFLERVGTSAESDAHWEKHIVTHYDDGHLERMRRDVVSLAMEVQDQRVLATRHAVQLREWARELREPAV